MITININEKCFCGIWLATSRYDGILDISQRCRLAWSVPGLALVYSYFCVDTTQEKTVMSLGNGNFGEALGAECKSFLCLNFPCTNVKAIQMKWHF
jgi:hypothetical protein